MGPHVLDGDLHVPDSCIGLVIFAHGSGSSRFSPRNRQVAAALAVGRLCDAAAGPADEGRGSRGCQDRAIPLRHPASRASRDGRCRLGIRGPAELRDLNIGYFGASTGAAAALIAAAERPDISAAVVSRGGRPDLAGDALAAVQAPTLLIVGGEDRAVIDTE